MQTGHPLYVLSVTVLMENFIDTFLKTVSIHITQLDDLASSSLPQTEEVVKLVEEQGYSEHRHPVVNSLLDSIGSTMSDEDFGLWVAQEVLLWHPVHYQGVVAQSRWTLAFVSPYYLIKKNQDEFTAYLFPLSIQRLFSKEKTFYGPSMPAFLM